MSRWTMIPVTTIALLGAGCTAKPPSAFVTPVAPQVTNTTIVGEIKAMSFSHFERPITLTTSEPTTQIGSYTVRLLSIAEDGTTQIQLVESRHTLTARPGESFVGREFGSKGLTLESASKATGTAMFTQRYAVSQ